MNITKYLKAGQPCLMINTNEVDRAIKTIKIDCKDVVRYRWDVLRGIINMDESKLVSDINNPIELIAWLTNQSNAVLYAENFQHLLNDVEVLQAVLNAIPIFKASGICFVLLGLNVKLPNEIENYFQLVEFTLPDIEHLTKIQEEIGKATGIEINHSSIEAAMGLTEFEAETAFALSLIEKKCFDASIVIENKKTMIKRSGLMEFYPPVDINEVGGLEKFKSYFKNRLKAFEPNSTLPKPKAMLLVGIPGTGKSLTCKAAANILGWPLIRLDIGSLKGSLVGQSEENLKRATNIIDAFGRAIVWIDEVEKAFAGVKSSGHTDGGTSANMFGNFLTWMQETTSDVLIMATANDINSLPPEFLRAGRFDCLFFVDLPNVIERCEIIKIMNNRYDTDLDEKLCSQLEGWTGAEIEQLAKDSLFDGIKEAKANIVPLSVTMKEEIDKLRKWAKGRARSANVESLFPKTNKRRNIKA